MVLSFLTSLSEIVFIKKKPDRQFLGRCQRSQEEMVFDLKFCCGDYYHDPN